LIVNVRVELHTKALGHDEGTNEAVELKGKPSAWRRIKLASPVGAVDMDIVEVPVALEDGPVALTGLLIVTIVGLTESGKLAGAALLS